MKKKKKNFGERMKALKARRERVASKRKAKASSPKKSSPRKTTTTPKKRTTTMAKGKSKGKSKSKRRSSGGGGQLGMTSKETQIALGAAALYGTLQAKAIAEGEAGRTGMDWFRKAPTITSIGRAATYALVFYILHRQGIGRGYTKPIAIGLAAVALLQLAQRGFKTYDESFKESALSGRGDDELTDGEREQIHLSGRLPIDAQHFERAA